MKTLNTLASIQLSQVIEQLDNHDTESLISIYNDYADMNKYERINDNDEHTINDLYSSPYDALLAASYGDYNPNHDYFIYDGYNNLSSFNYADDDNSPIDFDELAQWIVNNELYNDYNFDVTTLDDMLASIEDNITDNGYKLSKLADYLGQSLGTEQIEQLKKDDDYYDYLVSNFMSEISDYSYDDLYDLINTVGINYSVE